MTIKKTSNTPDAIKASAGGGKKSGGNGNIFLFAIVGVAILAIVIGLMMSGGEEEKKPTKSSDTSIAQAASVKSAKVYQKQGTKRIERSDGANAASAPEDFSNTSELVYMTEPETNIQMVKTSTGFVAVDSVEGQKFIADFNAYQAALNPNKPAAVAQSTISQEKINEIRQEANDQVRALDEKVNELAGQVDGLISVVKKQNETIGKLSTQIRTIQPMVKTPEELAVTLFGKNGKKVLKERNNALIADVVVGDKAFITDVKGDVHIVKVGDIIPGTSSVVALIDEASKQVVLKQ